MRNDVKGTLKTSFLAIKLNWQLLCCVFSVNRNEEKKYTKHADDTTLMAESEELESLDENERGEWKIGIKLNIQKTKIIASRPITSWQLDRETLETVSDFILGGSKINADGDCSHEIKRRLLLGRKVMTNLDNIFKSRDITLSTKVRLVKAMVFPVVMYGCENWPVKKAQC